MYGNIVEIRYVDVPLCLYPKMRSTQWWRLADTYSDSSAWELMWNILQRSTISRKAWVWGKFWIPLCGYGWAHEQKRPMGVTWHHWLPHHLHKLPQHQGETAGVSSKQHVVQCRAHMQYLYYLPCSHSETFQGDRKTLELVPGMRKLIRYYHPQCWEATVQSGNYT